MAANFLMGVYLTLYCIALLPFAILSVLLWALGVKSKRLGAFWYNQDRTLASGAWGTMQETISSEVGRISIGQGNKDGWTPRSQLEIRWAKGVAAWLNGWPAVWGVKHTLTAVEHADALDRADDGQEK